MTSAHVIVLLGAPGAGKGTAAVRLAKKLGFEHVSSGEMLRESVRVGSEAGRRAEKMMTRGELVPDDLAGKIIQDYLKNSYSAGFVLDGFPRTVAQARMLREMLNSKEIALSGVFLLKVSDEVLVERLSGRRVCEKCGAVFHVRTLPPRTEGVCDLCGGPLTRRPDDDPATVRDRLEVYRRETSPVIDGYAQSGALIEIDAQDAADRVVDKILTFLPVAGDVR